MAYITLQWCKYWFFSVLPPFRWVKTGACYFFLNLGKLHITNFTNLQLHHKFLYVFTVHWFSFLSENVILYLQSGGPIMNCRLRTSINRILFWTGCHWRPVLFPPLASWWSTWWCSWCCSCASKAHLNNNIIKRKYKVTHKNVSKNCQKVKQFWRKVV